MRILVFSNAFPPNIIGGGEYSAFNLSRGLSERGHTVSVVTMAETEAEQVWSQRTEEGFFLYRVKLDLPFTPFAANTGRVQPNSWQWLAWNINDVFRAKNDTLIRRIVDETDPTHVNVHSFGGFGLPSLEYVGRGRSVFWFLHDMSLVCTKGGMFKSGVNCASQCGYCRGVMELRLRWLRKVRNLTLISPSESNLHRVQSCSHFLSARPGRNIRNIPDRRQAQAKTASGETRTGDEIVVSYFGRLHDSKGVGFFIDALLASGARNIRFRIFGRGPEEERLRSSYGHSDLVQFCGFIGQDQVETQILASDLICTPSLWAEPYGRVTAQALQLCVPVIGSNIGGTTELVRDEVTGLLLPPGDHAAWVTALRRISQTPALVAEWRNNASALVGDFDETALLDLYEDEIGKAQARN